MKFNLSQIPDRKIKPRNSGLTMVMDKGLSVEEAKDFMSASHPHVDIVKLGFGTSFVSPNLREKLAVYRSYDIPVYFGGTLFEAFLIRNQFDDYIKVCKDFGISYMEVSDGSITIPHAEKCGYRNICSIPAFCHNKWEYCFGNANRHYASFSVGLFFRGPCHFNQSSVMIGLSTRCRYFLYGEATDMRKSFDGLCGIIRCQTNHAVLSGDVFIFINRRGDRIKLLMWDVSGFALYYKRLEQGSFKKPAMVKRNQHAGNGLVGVDHVAGRC